MGRVVIGIILVAIAAGPPALAQSPARSAVVTTGSITVMDPVALGQHAEFGRGAVVRPQVGAGVADVAGASYTLTGGAGETFNITAPTSIALTRAGGGEQIRLTLTPSQTQGMVAGQAGARGVTTFGLSGRLPLSSGAAGGLYVGQYGLTVAYP